MDSRSIDREGIDRRSFVKGVAVASAAAALGVAAFGTARSLISPKQARPGEILDTFVYVPPPPGFSTWYQERGLLNTEARLDQFEVGRGANVVWRPIRDEKGDIVPYGLPGLLIRLDEEELSVPPGYDQDVFVKSGLCAIFNLCTHAGCRPTWQLRERSTYLTDLGYENIYCICHDSQYNPRRFSVYQHDAPPLASGATYLGVHKEQGDGLGPAPRGMPLIPMELEGDKLVGVVKEPAWYQYLDFKALELEAED